VIECACACEYLRTYTYVNVCVRLYMYVCVYLYIYVCVRVCVYAFL